MVFAESWQSPKKNRNLIGRLANALVLIIASFTPRAAYAQFTDPKTYTVSPVDVNQLELAYTYAHADASIDTSLVDVGAHFVLNEAALSYTHNFGVLDHFVWMKASVPFATVNGSVDQANLAGSVTGAGDSSLELGALLIGGKALSAAEFATYEPATTLGLSLSVSAPTGDYNAQMLLNLGSNRWSFKPELGLSYPFGSEHRWEADAYVNAYFFTDNAEYRGVEILRQDPLPGLEGHISYAFSPDLWASLDARYAFHGSTVVDGLDQHNPQENLVIGAEASWSPNSHNTLDLVFAKAVVDKNAPAYTGFTVKYVYSWGPGTL
jgi:hypothetical protein